MARIVRRAFSDPQVPHESTGIHGRGTAEVKTNDVTGRVKAGEAGFVIEFGRPGLGARFREIQEMSWRPKGIRPTGARPPGARPGHGGPGHRGGVMTNTLHRFSEHADLGISINISAPMDAAARCCRATGLTRHSVEYSLGFQGRVERLPDRAVLEVSTMCGHGMVSHAFVRKMVDWVKEGRRPRRDLLRGGADRRLLSGVRATRAQTVPERGDTLA